MIDGDPEAQLDLRFAVVGGRTVLARRRVAYPYNVTAPLRTKGPARVIVQSISGGLYRGERLAQRIAATEGAEVLVELPTATVVQSMAPDETAAQGITLTAEAGATLVYLARPLILFPGGALAQTTEIVADRTATVLVREGFLLHDPQRTGLPFRALTLGLVARDQQGRAIAMDRARLDGSIIGESLPGVTNGFRAFGALWLIRHLADGERARLEAGVLALLAGDRSCYGATSALRDRGGLLVRLAATDGGALDAALEAVTALVRAEFLSHPSTSSG